MKRAANGANQVDQPNKVPMYVNQFDLSVSCTGKKSTAGAMDRYESLSKHYSSSPSQTSKSRNAQRIIKNVTMSVAPSIPSLLSIDSEADFGGNRRADHHEIEETEMYRKFEEAFNMTLHNNPGILPGAPAVIDSVKSALFQVQKVKAQRENEMRRKLDEVKNEKDQLEAQLRKEMGAYALRRNGLVKELETEKIDNDIQQDALNKQIIANQAIKRELTSKMTDITEEKEELTKHLSYLSKSRVELEDALETEMKNVQKDRDALQKVLAERKQLQKQKMENKELESRIESMSNDASKEKQALQAEVAELKKFEEHVSQLRKQNEEAREGLELEKKNLMEVTETMQTKKLTLMESLKDMEKQFQAEIDELHGKIDGAKRMHEEDVTNRVMGYLRRGARDETGRDEAVKDMGSPMIAERAPGSSRARCLKMELEADSVDFQASTTEDKMRREIDRLREDLEIIHARKSRHSSSPVLDRRDDVLQESRFQRSNFAVSPRYGGIRGYGDEGYDNRFYREETDADMRLHRRNLASAPPLIPRSPMNREEEEYDTRIHHQNLTPLRSLHEGRRARYYF
jgi:myosin heavy subunit